MGSLTFTSTVRYVRVGVGREIKLLCDDRCCNRTSNRPNHPLVKILFNVTEAPKAGASHLGQVRCGAFFCAPKFRFSSYFYGWVFPNIAFHAVFLSNSKPSV